MSKHNSKTIRELAYKSCVPYFILFDPDLNIQHIKLYTFIEQMESNPNPKIEPTFSYAWFANILDIEVRGAKKIAKVMKDKGYLIHKQNNDGRWVWSIAKKSIIDTSDHVSEEEDSDEGGCHKKVGGVPQEDTGGVPQEDTPLNNIKIKNYKEKTTTTAVSNSSAAVNSFFNQFVDKKLLEQRLSHDPRSDDEFLAECVAHVDNNSDDRYPRLQRAIALVKLLMRLKTEGRIFKVRSAVKQDVLKRDIKPLFTADDLNLISTAQHAKRMQALGQDISVFITKEDLIRAESLIAKVQSIKKTDKTHDSRGDSCMKSLQSLLSLKQHAIVAT